MSQEPSPRAALVRVEPSPRAALHARVRSFVASAARGSPTAETFDELGCALLRHQMDRVEPYRRLVAARDGAGDAASQAANGSSDGGVGLAHPPRTRVAEWPAVPTDAFRLARVAVHGEADDRAIFRTSGTTGDARGVHALSTTATYQLAALAWGAWGLFADRALPAPLTIANGRAFEQRIAANRESPLVWIVLAPPPAEAPDSSLGFMLDLFGRHFARETMFVIRNGSIDRGLLEQALERAAALDADVAVAGTSFAFVHLLDLLAGHKVPLGRMGRVMHTGGFKGKSREVSPLELRGALAETFAIDALRVVGEYGMTEMSSQLYESTLRCSAGLDAPSPSARPGVFFAPPWVRVVPVSGERLAPVPPGQPGLLRIEDLANVDSAVVIQTADQGRIVEGGGIELLGRAAGAAARGCSIAVDAMLGGSA